MKRSSKFLTTAARACLAVSALALAPAVVAQTPPPAWNQAGQFKYVFENVLVSTAVPGTWNVKVVFSVVNPTNGQTWNIKTDPAYQTTGAALTLDIGWDGATDFTNTGGALGSLAPITSTSLGTAPAAPVQVRNLHTPTGAAKPCTTSAECPGIADFNNRFWVQQSVTPLRFTQTVTTGRVGLEGRAVCITLPGCPSGPPYAQIPVRSEVADFAFLTSATPVAAMIADPRRPIVDFATKCANCHDGVKLSGTGTPIPRLGLHGNQRNENPKLCVICHNPNQTDAAFRVVTADPRTSGAEVSIDFKRMIHAIHAGGFRKTPFVVIGFNTSINDFSDVRFPGKLSDCTKCHLDAAGKGTFELPLRASVLGSTIATGSQYAFAPGVARTIDVDPNNDARISPTASACSACHDDSETRSHMIRKGGASFSTTQSQIGVTVKERCASCHGPGKDEDVRRAHEIRSSSSGTR